MGNLLGTPITEKETHTGWTPDGKLQYGVSSMQGWRIHMEDAHICQPFLYAEAPASSKMNGAEMSIKKQKNNEASTTTVMTPSSSSSSSQWTQIPVLKHSLYAVFDGHGGSFAAQYAGRNFCRVLSRNSHFVKYAYHIQTDTSTMTETEKAQHRTKGLSYLEESLTATFVELDREIYQHVYGDSSTIQDSNTIYGADYQHDEVTQWETIQEQHQNNNHNDDNHNDNNNDAAVSDLPDHHSPSTQQPHALSDPKIVAGEDSGTTAVVVIVAPDWIVCANAGDSRAVYSKYGHRAVPLSYDHKPDDEAEERRIREAGGFVSGNRVEGDLAVSRGLGDYRFKEPATVMKGIYCDKEQTNVQESKKLPKVDDQKVSPVPDIIVQNRNHDADEFIVVACDGIWDVQTNQQCVTMIAQIYEEGETDNGLVCEETLDCCLNEGSKDNMTALIVKMPAQSIGIGGGVLARRQIRMEAAKAQLMNKESSTVIT